MILDNQALFSDEQAVTIDAASTNVVKLNGEIAFGTPVEIFVQVAETFKSTEVSSVTVKIQTSDTENFSTAVDLASETLSAITAGTRANIKFLPKGNKGYVRLYYDLTFETGVSAATAGKITAGIVEGVSETH